MRRMWLLLVVAIFFGARAMMHQEQSVVIDSTRPMTPRPTAASRFAPAAENSAPSRFACDSRTRCSQMSSCEEAAFFLAHCPNTQMDGDGDGIPCEQQHCGR
jgi:hypothetical protein